LTTRAPLLKVYSFASVTPVPALRMLMNNLDADIIRLFDNLHPFAAHFQDIHVEARAC